MTSVINSFTINEHNKLTDLLSRYRQFFHYFEGHKIIFAVITKLGIAYYQGTYKIENTLKYRNILLNSNMYVEDFNYINENSFIINIQNMDIININLFRNNKTYELSQEDLESEKKFLKEYIPEFCRNRIVMNTIQYNIQILLNKKWFSFK